MTMRTKANRWAVCLRWGILIGVGAVTLPGAGWESGEENDNKIVPVVAKKDVQETVDESNVSGDVRIVVAYQVPRVYEQLWEAGLNRIGAQHFVSDLIEKQVFQYRKINATELYRPSSGADDSEQNGNLTANAVRAVWTDDGSVIVRATRNIHDRISRQLSALTETGVVYIRKIVSTGVMKTSELDRVGDWKKAGTFKAVKVTDNAHALKTNVVEGGVVTYSIVRPDQWEKVKPSDFTSEVPVTDSRLHDLHFTSCNGMTSHILSESFYRRDLLGMERYRLMISGIEGIISVQMVDETADRSRSAENRESDSASARLHFAYVITETPLGYGLQIADKNGKPLPHVVYQETVEVDVRTKLGRTVLIRRGKPKDSLRDWDGEFVIAVTLEQVPTELQFEPK